MISIPILADLANNFLYEEVNVYICFGSMIFAVVMFFVGFKHPIKYGKLFKAGKTMFPTRISSKWGFFIFNIIPLVFYVYFYYYYMMLGYKHFQVTIPFVCWVLLRLFRGTIYAYKRSRYCDPWPLESVLYYLFVNLHLAMIQARTTVVSFTGNIYSLKVLICAAVWLLAFIIGAYSDFKVSKARFKNVKGYKIMHGFLFEYVTSPNYLCELIMWVSWTLMFSFDIGCTTTLVWLLPNVLGRSVCYHKWATRIFKPSYPKKRTALIPFVDFNKVLEASMSFYEYGGF